MNDRKKRVRVLKPEPTKPTFVQRMERSAHRLAKRLNGDRERDVTLAVLTREMALTLDQIKGLRVAHEKARKSLLRHECYLNTQILERMPQPPVYDDPRLPERDRLRDRIRTVEKERRRLLISEEDQLRPLHDRLLALLNKHDQLHP